MKPNESEMLAWVESASFEDLIRKVRFEPIGSVWFSMPTVVHRIIDRIQEFRKKDSETCDAVSKEVGY
jgi:hypothetical protein